jgi:predicted HicB family RNase H-like nuclease
MPENKKQKRKGSCTTLNIDRGRHYQAKVCAAMIGVSLTEFITGALQLQMETLVKEGLIDAIPRIPDVIS